MFKMGKPFCTEPRSLFPQEIPEASASQAIVYLSPEVVVRCSRWVAALLPRDGLTKTVEGSIEHHGAPRMDSDEYQLLFFLFAWSCPEIKGGKG